MSEENPDQPPPKLQLSRKLKEPEKEDSPEEQPNLQLRRPAPEPETARPVQEDSTPEKAAEDGYDPKNPFGSTASEDNEPSNPAPPELPNDPPPPTEDGSAQKIEEAIDRIDEPKKSNHLVLSIVIILILVGLLGGASYGLYYVLRPAASETTAEIEESNDSSAAEAADSGGFLSNSIEAAKAAIAKVPLSAAEEVQAEEPAAAPPKEEVAEEDPFTEPQVSEPKPAATLGDGDSVSALLTTAHIGGVRTGDRPKVIMNGESYVPGDLVDARFGLRFIGFRDEKLAFKDEKGIVYLKSF